MIALTIIDLTPTVLHQAAQGYFPESMKGLLNAIRFVFSTFISDHYANLLFHKPHLS